MWTNSKPTRINFGLNTSIPILTNEFLPESSNDKPKRLRRKQSASGLNEFIPSLNDLIPANTNKFQT